MKVLLLTAALIGTLAACGDSDPDDAGDAATTAAPTDLDVAGKDFQSTDATVDGEPYALVEGTVLTLGFQDGAVQAGAGCNQMSGQGTYADGTLDVGAGLAMTQMACDPPEKMEQEQWYAEFLAAQPTMEQDGDQLVLTSGDTVITFTETVAPEATALTGTTWTLDGTGTQSSDGADGSMSSVPVGVTSTMQISDDGKVLLQAGCNHGSGQVEIEDSVLTFGPIALTRKLCDDAANQVEQTVVGVLDGEVDYSIDADVLTVTKGEQALTYRAGS